MILSRKWHLIFFCLLLSDSSWAQNSEKERLSGFAQHHKNQDQFDAARIQGERGYLEEEERWENQKNRSLEEYKKEKKKESMSEEGPEAKADAVAKKKYEEAHEMERRAYMENKSKEQKISRQAEHLPSEGQELGLEELRPRFDYRKRALYGARPKYGKLPGSSGGSSSYGGGSSSYGGSSGSSFPPPPTFDDFGGDGGYVPAPNMSDDFGDVPPPPPPPPPPPFGDDFGGFGGDFPPPPPPPPPFGDEGGDF